MGKQWVAGVVTIVLGVLFGLVIVGPPGNDPPAPLLRAEGATTTVVPAATEVSEVPTSEAPDTSTTSPEATATTSKTSQTTVPTAPPFPAEPLRSGASGADVRTWQQQMRKRGWEISTDGRYQSGAVAVCKAFQRQKGLNPSGVVDEATWDAAWTAPLPDDTGLGTRGS